MWYIYDYSYRGILLITLHLRPVLTPFHQEVRHDNAAYSTRALCGWNLGIWSAIRRNAMCFLLFVHPCIKASLSYLYISSYVDRFNAFFILHILVVLNITVLDGCTE